MNASALRCLYSASPTERKDRIEAGLVRAGEALKRLEMGKPGSADRIELLAGLLHALEREARSLLVYDHDAGGRSA